jgi:hypothetical protein
MDSASKTDALPAMPADDWMSIGDASRQLGESRLAVQTRIIKGEIVAQHIAGRTFVRRDSVDRILAGLKPSTMSENR